MSRLRSIWLVARREIIERGRSRGFLFSVLFTTVVIVAFVVVPPILFGGEDEQRVGLLGEAPPGLADALEERGQLLGQQLEISTIDEVGSALEDGDLAAVIELPADLASPGTVSFHDEVDQLLLQVVTSVVVEQRSAAVLESADVDRAALGAAQTPPTVHLTDPPEPDQDARFLLANIGAILVLVGIFGFGFTLLGGVVEEKQSRVVEVVLSTVRPRDLLMGKVLGIGALGLVQLAVFVLASLAAALVTQAIELPATTPGAIAMLALWFILGYLLYATVLGAVGALASRMEEASNASTPVTMVAMLSYFVAVFGVLEDPNGPVAVITTFLPITAPFVVPLRAALDAIAAWELVLSVVITLLTVWLLFEVGARIYSGAVLETAGRTRLRDAWRAGR